MLLLGAELPLVLLAKPSALLDSLVSEVVWWRGRPVLLLTFTACVPRSLCDTPLLFPERDASNCSGSMC